MLILTKCSSLEELSWVRNDLKVLSYDIYSIYYTESGNKRIEPCLGISLERRLTSKTFKKVSMFQKTTETEI